MYAQKNFIWSKSQKKKKNSKLTTENLQHFSALLVHGNGENTTNKIRYAWFGIIPKSKVSSKKMNSKNNTYIEF